VDLLYTAVHLLRTAHVCGKNVVFSCYFCSLIYPCCIIVKSPKLEWERIQVYDQLDLVPGSAIFTWCAEWWSNSMRNKNWTWFTPFSWLKMNTVSISVPITTSFVIYWAEGTISSWINTNKCSVPFIHIIVILFFLISFCPHRNQLPWSCTCPSEGSEVVRKGMHTSEMT